jgi:hypothetical protein
MCAQCMMSAVTSATAATGARAWLASRDWNWVTPVLMKRITVGLITAALIASALLVSGSSQPT